MWNGKNKAITFSFDDGVRQDKKVIELLNKYNIKATFNLNSSCFGSKNIYMFNDIRPINRDRFTKEEIKDVYFNHEVAAHGLTHCNLTTLSDEDVIKEVELDRKQLSNILGYEVNGFAYPCGGVNCDERVAKILKEKTGIKFARTTISSYSFEIEQDLILFRPTIYFREYEKAVELAKQFVNLITNTPKIFYIWCHSYEFDYTDDGYNLFEEFLKIISNKDDIFYGTNSEVLLGDN